jgi:membrane associated rhomboid family serine protease
VRRIPPVTLFLLIANVAVYLLQSATGDTLLIDFALVAAGGQLVQLRFEPWQVVTYAFLHGSWTHLGFNMLALYMFGGPLEELWGRRPFLVFYFACVIAAALTQLAVMGVVSNGDHFYPTLGASGGVFGLLLGFGMMYPHQTIMLLIPPIPMPAWLFVILYGLVELFLGLTGREAGVAHFAHLGGLAAGFILIQYWRGRLPIRPRRILTR